uniref:Anti-proliferative protein domain-containing protein n=1 Tax=Arcella intermedia TaxID=1963864 RepID=A0A6B2LFX1_9EUKA
MSKEVAALFEKNLFELLVKKIKDHWFPEKPLKGQGYRAVVLDKYGHLDPILDQSAKLSGISNLYSCFSYVESIVMWIDPDEVAVRTYWAYSQGGKEQVIYKAKVVPALKPTSEPFTPSKTKVAPLPDLPPLEVPLTHPHYGDLPYLQPLPLSSYNWYPRPSWSEFKPSLKLPPPETSYDPLEYQIIQFPKKDPNHTLPARYKTHGQSQKNMNMAMGLNLDVYGDLGDDWDSTQPLEAQA